MFDFFQNFCYLETYIYVNLDIHSHTRTHICKHTQKRTWVIAKSEIQCTADLPKNVNMYLGSQKYHSTFIPVVMSGWLSSALHEFRVQILFLI